MLHSVSQNQVISVLILATVLLHYTSEVQSQDSKQETCCPKVSRARIRTKIDDCILTDASDQCLRAVMFLTKEKYYCSDRDAPWVIKKLKDLDKKGRPCRNSTSDSVATQILLPTFQP